jgi:hypothetical protein
MIRLGLVVAALLACVGSANAQLRTNNANTPGVLRQWPRFGVWETVLARSVATHDLTCVMATGYNNLSQGENYVWGIRQDAATVGLEIADSNPAETSVPSITVTIDGLTVGTYPMTNRVSFGQMNLAIAALSKPNAESLMKLVRLGGAIKFSTSAATYSASLAGVGAALMNLNMCVAEMTQLDVLHVSGSQQ